MNASATPTNTCTATNNKATVLATTTRVFIIKDLFQQISKITVDACGKYNDDIVYTGTVTVNRLIDDTRRQCFNADDRRDGME
jgi:hypothetical protein